MQVLFKLHLVGFIYLIHFNLNENIAESDLMNMIVKNFQYRFLMIPCGIHSRYLMLPGLLIHDIYAYSSKSNKI